MKTTTILILAFLLTIASAQAVTVQLNVPDVDVLEDTYTQECVNDDDNFGIDTLIRLGNDGDSCTNLPNYFKYNLEYIPSDAEISEVMIAHYAWRARGTLDTNGNTINVSMKQVSNQTWLEGTGNDLECVLEADCGYGITYNRRPSIGAEIDWDASYTGTTIEDRWLVFNGTSFVASEHSAGNNFTFSLDFDLTGGGAASFDVRSKETSSTDQISYANVTFQSPSASVWHNVTLMPEHTLFTNESLNCSATYISNISSGHIEFIWYKNGVYQAAFNGTSNTLNEGQTGYTNAAPTITAGDNWTCSARAHNTTTYGDFINSSQSLIHGWPYYGANTTSRPDTYEPSTTSWFNITWNIDTDTISTVYLESNHTGTMTNYSMTAEGSTYYFSTILPAGNNHVWRSYAISSQDTATNMTDQNNYSISKADNGCHINVTVGSDIFKDVDTTASTSDDVTVLGYCDAAKEDLLIDGTVVENPKTQTYGVGTYWFYINASSNTNYTANATGINLSMTATQAVAGGGGGGFNLPSCDVSFDNNDTLIIDRKVDQLKITNNANYTFIPTFQLQKDNVPVVLIDFIPEFAGIDQGEQGNVNTLINDTLNFTTPDNLTLVVFSQGVCTEQFFDLQLIYDPTRSNTQIFKSIQSYLQSSIFIFDFGGVIFGIKGWQVSAFSAFLGMLIGIGLRMNNKKKAEVSVAFSVGLFGAIVLNVLFVIIGGLL